MTDDDTTVLAGEYVLGLLPAGERTWLERARLTDTSLDDEILAWQFRLAALDAVIPQIPPDPVLWARIEAALGEPEPASTAPATVTTRATAAPPQPRRGRPAGEPRRRPGLLASTNFWRGTSLIATAAAIALAVTTYLRPPTMGPGPVPIAVSVLEDRTTQTPGWLVEVFQDGNFRVLPLVTTNVPQDRALQLWTLRDPAEGPISMGLLPVSGRPALSRSELLPVAAGQLFEISVEPPTGSPTGRPTGPVLFIGRAAQPPT